MSVWCGLRRWVLVLGLGAPVLALATACTFFLANQPPIARIAATPLTGQSPLVVQFDGSGSADRDGAIVDYSWDFGDEQTALEKTTHHTYVVAGVTATVFTATLTVRDDRGAVARAQQSIEVRPGGPSDGGGAGAPVAQIAVDRIAGAIPLVISFDASGSEAGTGTVVAYNWDFGDGATASGVRVSHAYQPNETREFTVTLFVWNSEGSVDVDEVQVVAIVPADVTGDEQPFAELSMSAPVLLHESTNPATSPTLYEVTFDPRGSYADAGHAIEYYIWDFGDGSAPRIETNDLQLTHVYQLSAPSRTFVVRLFVYDDQGLEDVALANLTLAQPEDEEE